MWGGLAGRFRSRSRLTRLDRPIQARGGADTVNSVKCSRAEGRAAVDGSETKDVQTPSTPRRAQRAKIYSCIIIVFDYFYLFNYRLPPYAALQKSSARMT